MNSYDHDSFIVFSSYFGSKLLPASLAPPAHEVFFSAYENGIYIGRSEYLGIPVFWNSVLYPNGHCCVTGMTGSGKTYFTKSFISRANVFLNSRILIIDWTGEYVNWCNESGGTTIDMSKTAFNMFPAINCQQPKELISDLVFVLSIVCDLSQEESLLLTECFQTLHAKLSAEISEGNNFQRTALEQDQFNKPMFEFIMERIRSECGRVIYSKIFSVHDMIKKILSGTDSLDSLFGRKRVLCLDFSRIHSEKERVLLAHVVLHLIVQKMRFIQKGQSFIVIDEAWRILKKRTTEALLREGRKYYHNLILATQNISDFDESLFSNFASFFIFRTQSFTERERLKKSLLLDEQTVSRLGNLYRGQCFCRFSLNGKPSLCFFVKIVEGEEGIVWYAFKFGDDMEVQIERDFLIKRFRELGLSNSDVTDMINILDSRRNEISLVELCKKLISKGISTAQAISFMRSISIRDDIIVNVLAELQDSESNLVDVAIFDQEEKYSVVETKKLIQ